MQIKNKIITITIFCLSFSVFDLNIRAEEFNISAVEISIDKKNNIVPWFLSQIEQMGFDKTEYHIALNSFMVLQTHNFIMKYVWCDFGGLTPKNAVASQEKLIFRPMRDLFAEPIICSSKISRGEKSVRKN